MKVIPKNNNKVTNVFVEPEVLVNIFKMEKTPSVLESVQQYHAKFNACKDKNIFEKNVQLCLEKESLRENERALVYLFPQKFRKASSSSGRGYKELQTKKEYFVVRYIGE